MKELQPISALETDHIDASFMEALTLYYNTKRSWYIESYSWNKNPPKQLPTSQAVLESIYESLRFCKRVGLSEEFLSSFYLPSTRDPYNPKDISYEGLFGLTQTGDSKYLFAVEIPEKNDESLYKSVYGWRHEPTLDTFPKIFLRNKECFYAGDMSQEETVIERAAELKMTLPEYIRYASYKTLIMNFRCWLAKPVSKSIDSYEESMTTQQLMEFVGDTERYKLMATDIINEEIYDYSLIDPNYRKELKRLERQGDIHELEEYEMYLAGRATPLIVDSLHVADLLGIPKEKFYDLITPAIDLSKPLAIQLPLSDLTRILKERRQDIPMSAHTISPELASVTYKQPGSDTYEVAEYAVQRNKLPDLYESDDAIFADELLAAKNLICDLLEDVFSKEFPQKVNIHE